MTVLPIIACVGGFTNVVRVYCGLVAKGWVARCWLRLLVQGALSNWRGACGPAFPRWEWGYLFSWPAASSPLHSRGSYIRLFFSWVS